jgi:hypothetical protein
VEQQIEVKGKGLMTTYLTSDFSASALCNFKTHLRILHAKEQEANKKKLMEEQEAANTATTSPFSLDRIKKSLNKKRSKSVSIHKDITGNESGSSRNLGLTSFDLDIGRFHVPSIPPFYFT